MVLIAALLLIGWIGGAMTGRIIAALLSLLIFVQTGAPVSEWALYYLCVLILGHAISSWLSSVRGIVRE